MNLASVPTMENPLFLFVFGTKRELGNLKFIWYTGINRMPLAIFRVHYYTQISFVFGGRYLTVL